MYQFERNGSLWASCEMYMNRIGHSDILLSNWYPVWRSNAWTRDLGDGCQWQFDLDTKRTHHIGMVNNICNAYSVNSGWCYNEIIGFACEEHHSIGLINLTVIKSRIESEINIINDECCPSATSQFGIRLWKIKILMWHV